MILRLSGADELWSSSKDVSNSPSKPLPSIWASQDLGLDIRTEFEQQENQPFPFTGKANGPSSQSVPSGQTSLELSYMATCGFCNHTNPYSTMPVISASQHPDVKNQLMHSSYSPATAISVNMITDASARPSTTVRPQEKLENIRRRQEMQAMLD
ncbi:hypothetical protein IGI04_014586 [Brassica rapa subsp. trilocularis]|uniref:BHLH domain-containing protein n=1 Tax=Brassica rapa subsp. trilocularis TaxID=1813537 RepID=A0ABQ7MML9_BRACM|nr:hypothetical protein IGI04_014586 [Brassica rapa subsp. trilocularis]